MYVVNYCQIYSFHQSVNLDKIVIYKTFPQTSEQIYDLIHFRKEHAPFFNGVSFRQLKDAASAVLAREKSTSLTELFSIELKFTIDTLKDWFNSTIKPNLFEIDSLNKMDWRKKKPVNYHTKCTICDFNLAVETKNGWFEDVFKAEHFFFKKYLLR